MLFNKLTASQLVSNQMESELQSPNGGHNGGPLQEGILSDRQVISWLIEQPISDQDRIARHYFQTLLDNASQPRHVSGNACIKLCYFLDQCKVSSSQMLRNLAFSKGVCFDLLDFYIEWSEKNQNRSMRQILELLVKLVATNPDKVIAEDFRVLILQRLLSIIAHESAQPLVKPAFKVLECLLGKRAVSVRDLIIAYSRRQKSTISEADQGFRIENLLDPLVANIFDWMTLPDVSPAAGRLLVTLFQEYHKTQVTETTLMGHGMHGTLWSRWIQDGLDHHPESLENVKNFLFPPLFRLDRGGSLEFLQHLARETSIEHLHGEELDARSFLFLSAMEVGKRSGLVDDGDTAESVENPKKIHTMVCLPEEIIGALMSHASSMVRSSALSVLISSNSSTRPFSNKTLQLLQEHLFVLHVDTDAKFRNDLLSNTKHLVERLRDAMASLWRNLNPRLSGSNVDGKPCDIEAPTLDLAISALAEKPNMGRLQSHRNFLEWYIKFLANELVPTAAYQRHITALKALHIVLKSNIISNIPARGPQPCIPTIFNPSLVRLLMDLILDPFEDVRDTATSIMKIAPIEVFERKSFAGLSESQPRHSSQEGLRLELLQDLVNRAEDSFKRTGRADIADGVARSQELLFHSLVSSEERRRYAETLVTSLEAKVTMAEVDLAKAVATMPIHAQFAALRLIWESLSEADVPEDWRALQERIIKCCRRIWAAVRDILCNDSPEGYLPADLEEVDVVDTKDVLSYSFRAIHESSNLMRTVVCKLRSTTSKGLPLLTFDVFRAAGDLSFEQLSTLRHRGAFSTVSLTFAKCCQLTQDKAMANQPAAALLDEWYKGTLVCIYQQASTTRRSAGIPALVTGILSAGALSPGFNNVVDELKLLSRQPVSLSEIDETNLPQVHAMNCLKEIFKSSVLGKRADSHIADCVQLAADSLQCNVYVKACFPIRIELANFHSWAIRNCGLILLRSLIDSLFGTSESKLITEAGWDGKSIKLSYDRYPALPEILLKLLSVSTDNESLRLPAMGSVESVFPALDIIRRAGPPEKFRKEIYDCVSSHLSSKVWHIRDIASRTITTLLLHEDWVANILSLLDRCVNSVNRQHGTLLALKHVLERHLELDQGNLIESLDIIYAKVESNALTFTNPDCSPELQASYEEVKTVILKITLQSAGSSSLSSLLSRVPYLTGLIGNQNLSSETFLHSSTLQRSTLHNANGKYWGQSPLLSRSLALRTLYIAVLTSELDQLKILNGQAAHEDIDTACTLLEHVPLVWNIRMATHEELSSLLEIYFTTLDITSSSDLRSLALQGLASVLERLSKLRVVLQPQELEKAKRYALSKKGTGSLELMNAEMHFSGPLLLHDYHQSAQLGNSKNFYTRMKAWGEMVSLAGVAENDFDLRLSAAASLGSFYRSLDLTLISTLPALSSLPSLIALYDVLNDDDDEIRNMGAETVYHLLNRRLEPLAAKSQLLKWLAELFGKSSAFHDIALVRITGRQSAFRSAEDQLREALVDDNALFVEEEQNLYIDHVRELMAWTALITYEESWSWTGPALSLSSWAIKGLKSLNKSCRTNEDLIGKLSKPRVFAICMGVVQSTMALVTYFRTVLVSSGVSPEANHGIVQVIPFVDKVHEALESLEAETRSLLVIGSQADFHPCILDILQECQYISPQ